MAFSFRQKNFNYLFIYHIQTVFVYAAASWHRRIWQMYLCEVVAIAYTPLCTLKNRDYSLLSSVCEFSSVMVQLQTRRLPADLGQDTKLFSSVKTIASKVRAGPLAVKTRGMAGT